MNHLSVRAPCFWSTGAQATTRRLVSTFLLLCLGVISPISAQQKVTEMELRALMNEQREAVVLYRDGRIDEALAVLRRRTPSMNHRIAERILAWLEDPQPQLRDPKNQLVQHWNAQLVGTLAALQMEMALRVVAERGTVEEYRAHLRTARLLFDGAARAHGEAVTALLPRWVLAIGATAHAEGQVWWAAEILEAGCQAHPNEVDLLVACGAVHETIAALPAHILLSEGHQQADSEAVRFGVDTRQQAVAVRNRRLGAARRLLEHALAITPAHVEARLRLARVLSLSGDDRRAAPLLEPLLQAGDPPERRSAFLARLMLGTIRVRLGARSDAVRLFAECVELVPSAQSGYVALANALHSSGKVSEASSVTERMFNAPAHPPDPWASYSYGQYWIAEPLLESLRKEARR